MTTHAIIYHLKLFLKQSYLGIPFYNNPIASVVVAPLSFLLCPSVLFWFGFFDGSYQVCLFLGINFGFVDPLL